MSPSWLCHRFESHDSVMFTTPFGMIIISGYKLLYLYPFPIFKFPRLIIHVDSLRDILFQSSASMLMETRLLFAEVCAQTFCVMHNKRHRYVTQRKRERHDSSFDGKLYILLLFNSRSFQEDNNALFT